MIASDKKVVSKQPFASLSKSQFSAILRNNNTKTVLILLKKLQLLSCDLVISNELYTPHKSNSPQKQLPAHSMITKRVFILRGSCFCETYSTVVSGQNATGQNATMSKTDKMPQCRW